MGSCKFKDNSSYLISDPEELVTIKISVQDCDSETYYIYWHDEKKGEFCSKEFFDTSFIMVEELSNERSKMQNC